MEPKKEKPKQEQEGKAKEHKEKPAGKIVVVRIRNITRASGAVRDTLRMMRLRKKYTCSIIDKNKSHLGMLEKIKDYTTYGEIDAETLKMLEEKRGKKDKQGKLKRHFHLHPPRGGFERKGIKHSFTQGGALGYRGGKINVLIKKML